MPTIDIGEDRVLVYASASMASAVSDAQEFASVDDMRVLITGESGTGKEGIARLLHFSSERKDEPFVALNCGAIPEALIEAELFGYEKGAFTGADRRRAGKFEQANGGTLFLDEISEMPFEMQVRLLRVLQEGKFHRIGGDEVVTVTPRILSATNADPEKAVAERKLRNDLFYRLRGVEISLTPLRERPDDIMPLAQHFVSSASAKYGFTAPELPSNVEEMLMSHDWPGNVRELENRMGEAVIRAKTRGVIQPADIRFSKSRSAAVSVLGVFDTDVVDIEATFGFQVSRHREGRNLTQAKLAHEMSDQLPCAITVDDIVNWESNTIVPDQAMVNALAYVLIIANPNISGQEEQQALEQFFDAAHTTREAIRDGISLGAVNNLFGGLVQHFRERAELTQSQFADDVNTVNTNLRMMRRDIYDIETNAPSYELVPQVVLGVVKALDSNGRRLTTAEKKVLYDSAREQLSRPTRTREAKHTVVEGGSGLTVADSEVTLSEEIIGLLASLEDLYAKSIKEPIKPKELERRIGNIFDCFFPRVSSAAIANYAHTNLGITKGAAPQAFSRIKSARGQITQNILRAMYGYLENGLEQPPEVLFAFTRAVAVYNALYDARERARGEEIRTLG